MSGLGQFRRFGFRGVLGWFRLCGLQGVMEFGRLAVAMRVDMCKFIIDICPHIHAYVYLSLCAFVFAFRLVHLSVRRMGLDLAPIP